MRPLARDLRVLIGWPFPLGFGLDGRLLLARRGRVYVYFIITRVNKSNKYFFGTKNYVLSLGAILGGSSHRVWGSEVPHKGQQVSSQAPALLANTAYYGGGNLTVTSPK